jgi:hypothetical protein
MPRYTPIHGFSDKFSQERITVRLHALKEVKESMSKQCLIEPKNNYNGLVFRPGAGWPEGLTRDTPEIKNLKKTFRAVFSAQIEKCARNFRPERFSITFRDRESFKFWVDWNNAWRDAQKAGQLRGPEFKIEEELERIFKDMESYLYKVFDEMMRAEMQVIVRKTATQKNMEPNTAIEFKVIQGKLAMDFHWNRKTRRDVLCRFEEEEKDDATESGLGADQAAAAQLINEANQPRGNRVRPSENEVEVCRTVLQSMIEVLRTRKNEISAEAFLEFPEFIPGELYWVRRLKRRMRLKYREHLGSLAMLIDDPFFHTTVKHSIFCTYVANWSERFEGTQSLYTPGPLERVENIYDLQRKLRKLDRHMSTFLISYYNYEFTKRFRNLCSMEMKKNGLPDNTMWFQIRLRESYEENKHHEHHLNIATHLPNNLAQSMVWDKRWDDIFSDYIDPDYDFDAEDDGDMKPVNIDELPRVFNGICTIKRDGKMEHQTLIEEEEPNEDEVIEIDDEDAPQEVVPEGGRRKRGRPRKEDKAAKRRRLTDSGRDEALLDESTRGRSPQRSDDARQIAYRQRASSASSALTELDDDIVEALNPANDNDATIVADSGGVGSPTQASNSNGANNNAAGPSRKRQNAGTIGFSGDGGDERQPKRSKKELPADKDADDEDQPDPKDKGKGKEIAPIDTGKKKRGRPKGSKNKPKIPIPPNLVNGNSNMINSRVLIGAGPTPPGCQPPPNPVPGPDDIPDNAVLMTSDRPLNSSSVRIDTPLPNGVNIKERPQYLTTGPLASPLLDPRGIFANRGRVMQRPRIRAELMQPRPEEQQQRQQQPGNQQPQAPQQPCTRISPSHAGDNSSVPPQAGTAHNPIDLDSEQQLSPTSQRPTTNSPHPGAPNLLPADQSQAGPSSILPSDSGAPQPRQQDQQQSMNTNLLQQGIARLSPVAQPQKGQPNTIPSHPGSHQPRAQFQPPRPLLADHPATFPAINRGSLGQPLVYSHDQFKPGRGQSLPSPMPPPQGKSLHQVTFPGYEAQGHAGPSPFDAGTLRIWEEQAASQEMWRKNQKDNRKKAGQEQNLRDGMAIRPAAQVQAGGGSQNQFGIQQQSPSPRWGPHRPSLQQGQYYGQPQYNMPYYVQQGGTSHNTFATVQGQSQNYAFYQRGSPVQQGIRHLPPPPPPYEAIQQFQPEQFHPPQIENPVAQYQAAAQYHPGFYHPPLENQRIMSSPIQQQMDLQQLIPPMSQNPSGNLQGAPRQTYGEALQGTMQEIP